MELTKVERWILSNQYRILEHVDPDSADHYHKMRDILERGYELEYDWKTEHIYDDRYVMTEDKCQFVINVFSMYDALQRSYREVPDTGEVSERDVLFRGFDGNNETEYLGYARFLREQDNKFTFVQIANDDLNSHMPTLEIYRRMNVAWDELEEKHDLALDEIETILDARRHPEA